MPPFALAMTWNTCLSPFLRFPMIHDSTFISSIFISLLFPNGFAAMEHIHSGDFILLSRRRRKMGFQRGARSRRPVGEMRRSKPNEQGSFWIYGFQKRPLRIEDVALSASPVPWKQAQPCFFFVKYHLGTLTTFQAHAILNS